MKQRPIDWTGVRDIVMQKSRFLVTSHVDTDGDALASVLGFGTALEALGKQVRFVIDSEIPTVYEPLPDIGRIENPGSVGPDDDFEVAVVLDAPNLDRIGRTRGCLKGQEILIDIDHHEGNEFFGAVNVVAENAPATSYLVFECLKSIDSGLLDVDRSTLLYVGLLGDTGGFRFPNTNRQAFEMASEVLDRGVNVSELAHSFLYGWSASVLRLLALTLGTLKVSDSGRVASLEISREMLRRTESSMKDSEGFVSFASTIPGVVLAMLLKEREEKTTRASLRSHGSFDVASVARHFGGGGHANAAGCTLQVPLYEAREELLRVARERLPS